MITLACFDLDGTIINSLADLTQAVNYALREEGLPEKTLTQVQSYIGNGVTVLVHKAVEPVRDTAVLARVKAGFDAYYAEHVCDDTEVYPGIRELFHLLRKNGVQIAVFSNKPDQFVRVILDRLFPEISFAAAVGNTERFPTKPDPSCFNYWISQLRVDKKQCIYIGDSDIDVHFATNAQVPSIGVLWGFMDRERLAAAGADYLVEDTSEIGKIILSLNIEGM